jgi:hypothetical protein
MWIPWAVVAVLAAVNAVLAFQAHGDSTFRRGAAVGFSAAAALVAIVYLIWSRRRA